MPMFTVAMPTHLPGRLSTMTRPEGDGLLAADMRLLRTNGVDVLVSLQTEDERARMGLAEEPRAAEQAGLEFHEHPIVDFGVPDRAQIQPLLEYLVEQLQAGRHVAVHCFGGRGRSSLVAGALLIAQGLSPDDACTLIGAARGSRVPETDEQRQWLDGCVAAAP